MAAAKNDLPVSTSIKILSSKTNNVNDTSFIRMKYKVSASASFIWGNSKMGLDRCDCGVKFQCFSNSQLVKFVFVEFSQESSRRST